MSARACIADGLVSCIGTSDRSSPKTGAVGVLPVALRPWYHRVQGNGEEADKGFALACMLCT